MMGHCVHIYTYPHDYTIRKNEINMRTDYAYINNYAKLLKAIKYLGGKCKKCNETYFLYLDFHHMNNKKDTVRKLLYKQWSKIKPELDKCILLCCKCHRLEHFNVNRYKTNEKYILKQIDNIDELGTNGRMDNYIKNKELIINMLKEDNSIYKIHKITGVSKKAIRDIAFTLDIDRSILKNEKDINIDKFIEMYNNKTEMKDIAKYFNCSVFPIFRIRKKLILDGSIAKHQQRIIDINELKQCLLSNMSTKEIAQKFNMKIDSINKRIHRQRTTYKNWPF